MDDKPEWIEIAVSVTSDYADIVANFLIEQGSNGIVEERSKSNRGSVVLKAYLKKDARVQGLVEKIEAYLKSLLAAGGAEPVSHAIILKQIPDEDWNKKWKSFFEPLKVTDRIVIKPSWRNYWKKEPEIVLELDPGMAFGTGTHPSTRMCLRAIEEWAETFPDKKDISFLDVGTGSGILAIAAALLGIKKVVGIDNDYQAVTCAKRNAGNNGVENVISLSTRPLKKIGGTFNMVVANILPHILIEMRKELVALLDPGGFLVLSGILKEKAQEVSTEFSKQLKFYKELKEEEWACLVFLNKPSG
jgi:ribosomal protein L11 methyltransferase